MINRKSWAHVHPLCKVRAPEPQRHSCSRIQSGGHINRGDDQRRMDVILQAILDGSLDWELARRWILAESDDAAAPLPVRGPYDREAAVTPSACRRYALGYIREQVAQLLARQVALPHPDAKPTHAQQTCCFVNVQARVL